MSTGDEQSTNKLLWKYGIGLLGEVFSGLFQIFEKIASLMYGKKCPWFSDTLAITGPEVPTVLEVFIQKCKSFIDFFIIIILFSPFISKPITWHNHEKIRTKTFENE